MATKPSYKDRAHTHLKAARDIAANAETAARELTADEQKTIETNIGQARDLMAQADAAAKNRAAFDEIGEALSNGEAGELNAKALENTQAGLGGHRKSIGESFVESASFKGAGFGQGGRISKERHVSTDPFSVEGGLKALITTGQATSTSDSSASLLVDPQRLGMVPYPYVAPTLRNVVTVGTTTSDRIEYAQLLPAGHPKVINGAHGVKESPATDGTVGVKPQSSFGFRKASADIITIANWIPVTKQALSDAAQIRTLIDAFLTRNLEEEVERQIIEGNKADPVKGEEEYQGILNTSGTQAQAFDTDLFVTTRKAISKVTKLNGRVSSILVSPEMDETLDLMRDGNDRFYGQGPYSMGPNTLWGRPRIVTPALSGRGKFILGDLSQCVLWDREQANVTATDAHEDYFVRNLVAVLAEARSGFGILNPGLLVIGDEKAVTP